MFDLVEQHENAILDRTNITLPANTETTAVPTKIDITQDGVIVLRQIFSGSEFYFDKATQSTVMTDQSYTDEIESVEWIVDDPSIAEAVPQVSPERKDLLLHLPHIPARPDLSDLPRDAHGRLDGLPVLRHHGRRADRRAADRRQYADGRDRAGLSRCRSGRIKKIKFQPRHFCRGCIFVFRFCNIYQIYSSTYFAAGSSTTARVALS